jgi:hypothetical protein
MSNTASLIVQFNQILPDERIAEDLRDGLRNSSSMNFVAIELEEERIQVPCDVSIQVVSKALFKDRYNIPGWGTLRAQVALGEVTDPLDGTAFAEYCFGTLYYDENCNLISSDFHKSLR